MRPTVKPSVPKRRATAAPSPGPAPMIAIEVMLGSRRDDAEVFHRLIPGLQRWSPGCTAPPGNRRKTIALRKRPALDGCSPAACNELPAGSFSRAGYVAQVRACHRHDLSHPAAKDLLAHCGGEPGDLLAGDLGWQRKGARVSDDVDERGSRVRQRVPQCCPDVRGLLDSHGVDAH